MPKTVAFLKELGAKNVGMVYNALVEQNSVAQIAAVKEIAAKEEEGAIITISLLPEA